MGKDGRTDPGIFTLPLIEKAGGGLNIGGRIRDAGCRKINDPLGRHRPHPRISKGLGGLIFKKIAVGHGGGAGEDHLGCSQSGTMIDHLLIDIGGLGWKDMVGQPGGKLQIISQAAKKSHGAVVVAVDESRGQQHAAAVDDGGRLADPGQG